MDGKAVLLSEEFYVKTFHGEYISEYFNISLYNKKVFFSGIWKIQCPNIDMYIFGIER